MNTDQRINNLKTDARHATDPERLREIARELEWMSAWVEAREVERMAEEAERRMAEDATK